MMTCYKVTMHDGKAMTMLDMECADIHTAWHQLRQRFGAGRVVRVVDMNNLSDILCETPEVKPNVVDA